VLSLDPHSLDDVLASVLLVGERTGTGDVAQNLLDALRARLERVASAVAGRERPRLAVVEWVDPPFTAGHWVPDLIRAAGGEPVGGTAGERSVQTTWSEIRSAGPEVVIVAPCGYHLDGAVEQARGILAELPGVQAWAIDADGIVVRPGPRLVDGVEAIATVLHPRVLDPGVLDPGVLHPGALGGAGAFDPAKRVRRVWPPD